MNQETTPASADALDLAACDRERIHEISMVQGYGAFVSFTFPELRVQGLSANLASVMGLSEDPAEGAVGQRLDSLLDTDLVTEINQRVKLSPRASVRTTFEYRGRRNLDVFIYALANGTIAAELSPLPESASGLDTGAFDDFVKAARRSASVEELSQRACETVRKLTGLDRVMMYRFFPPSWYGEVIAEDRVAEAHSFRDHRFPASDIPKPARELYLRNQVRLIVDSEGADAALLPAPRNDKAKTIDLSDSRLRSVSRVHLAYLKNMKVRASFSVAITVGDQLWGLIACHGHRARYVTHGVRAICESVANTLALSLPMLESGIGQRAEIAFNEKLQSLFAGLRTSPDPREELLRSMGPVLDLFGAQGYAFVEGTQVDFAGLTPRRAEIVDIALQLREEMDRERKEVLAVESLGERFPQWNSVKEQASGVLAVLVPELSNALFLLFRPELLHTVQWGGNPHKAVESRNYQGPINPRVSFETWSETIRGRSAPWRAHEIKGASYFRSMVFDSLIRQDRLIKELEKLRAMV
jgi:two-component system, chemotaxis family, sensor kinase Cph1